MDEETIPWTDEEFDRLTRRLQAFVEKPESLTAAEYLAVAGFRQEMKKDAATCEYLIAKGVPVADWPRDGNPVREALGEWLAKFP